LTTGTEFGPGTARIYLGMDLNINKIKLEEYSQKQR